MDDLWIWLVVEPTPLKNMKVNWDDEIPNIWENKKCSKPPISYVVLAVWWELAVEVETIEPHDSRLQLSPDSN